MVEDRDALMSHAWPLLRQFCRKRKVELIEVDLRWGISEEQSTRKETLKICLDEIRACQPYFLGILGERYGWVPGNESFTPDLLEEQSWLADLADCSVTELEILQGVLHEQQMRGRSFFYFRDPAYLNSVPVKKQEDFISEDRESAVKLDLLKQKIRDAHKDQICQLREDYRDPQQLAEWVVEDMIAAIDVEFPEEKIPDQITRVARDQEAFAETRRRTFISRPIYFEYLDWHSNAKVDPLIICGETGSGKSALLANWVEHRLREHPNDFVFQHYVGGTPMRADHWSLMYRLISEIKHWTGDPEPLPNTDDDTLQTFPSWLDKARIVAEGKEVCFIIVLDALNQLEDRDHAHSLGWLPSEPFRGPLKLIVSTLEGSVLNSLQKREWPSLMVKPLHPGESRRMITEYLARFGKSLGSHQVERIVTSPATANPLYLKILLDELRVTGTHDRLDERLDRYLSRREIDSLLDEVFRRYERDYEQDRPGLVGDTLSLIWAARWGLTEAELLFILRPERRTQLPIASWAPLRSALDESLVDRGGVLNFAHDAYRFAAARRYISDETAAKALRLRICDSLALLPIDSRQAEELPWMLRKVEARGSLRACLLDIDRFLLMHKQDQFELLNFWVWMGEEKTMGEGYIKNFKRWERHSRSPAKDVAQAASMLGIFLFFQGSLSSAAEPLFRRALALNEETLGKNHPCVAYDLNNLSALLLETNRLTEAEQLLLRAISIDEQHHGISRSELAMKLNNLALILLRTDQRKKAVSMIQRGLSILRPIVGDFNPNVGILLSSLAGCLRDSGQLEESETLHRQVVKIMEMNFGSNHPKVAVAVGKLGWVLKEMARYSDAEPLLRRALSIEETHRGSNHPKVAACLNFLAQLLHDTNQLKEAEPLLRRALAIDENHFGANHPKLAVRYHNLSLLLRDLNRMEEARQLMDRADYIENLDFGQDRPEDVKELNQIAESLLDATGVETNEQLMRQLIEQLILISKQSGTFHPRLNGAINDYAQILLRNGLSQEQVLQSIHEICRENGFDLHHSKKN